MRYAIDAHAIGRHLTGNEVYVRNLLHGFAALDHDSEFIAYISENVTGAPAAVPSRFVQKHVSANSLVRLGYELTRCVRRDNPDLLHVQYTAPLGCPVPVVVSVHDVSFLEHPEYFPWRRSFQLRQTVRRTVEQAVKVITPSDFSRRAVARAYALDESKIEVVPIAVSSHFRPISRETAVAQVQARLKIRGPYLLTVGDLQPRKNQIGLIQAFERLMMSHPQLPHKLVIVGQKTWYGDRIASAAAESRVADRIIFTGFVSDNDLLSLYNGCDATAFPSFYEGFGLPILEAMACGRAVVCSNASAIPEVANAAALLFDPSSIDAIVLALRDILIDSELRTRMERLGQQRASLFTWERTARRTLEIYQDVVQVGQPAIAASNPAVSARR